MTPTNPSIVGILRLQYGTVITKVFHPLCSGWLHTFKRIIHIIFLTRKSRSGRSVTDWQAATPAYQPIACGLLCDLCVRKTLWINSFSFEDQSVPGWSSKFWECLLSIIRQWLKGIIIIISSYRVPLILFRVPFFRVLLKRIIHSVFQTRKSCSGWSAIG